MYPHVHFIHMCEFASTSVITAALARLEHTIGCAICFSSPPQQQLNPGHHQLLAVHSLQPNQRVIQTNSNIYRCATRERHKPFAPFLRCPPRQPLERYGNLEDGGKLFCDLGVLQAPCLIISLGSRNEYSFEQDVLNRTQCEVHSYDCTVDGMSVMPGRHFFHKKCLGSNPDDPSFMTWPQVRKLQQQPVDLWTFVD
jgi:hypothetical protein